VGSSKRQTDLSRYLALIRVLEARSMTAEQDINKITKTVDMHGDFGAIYASKRIAAAIRARGR